MSKNDRDNVSEICPKCLQGYADLDDFEIGDTIVLVESSRCEDCIATVICEPIRAYKAGKKGGGR